jgi:hypothetical protein
VKIPLSTWSPRRVPRRYSCKVRSSPAHLGDGLLHILNGNGFSRFRHHAFQRPNVGGDASQQNALSVLNKLDLVAGFDTQSLKDALGQRDITRS